ncbi:TetR/AcrR family transcriptional regulator [Streptomyces sp. S1D4-11]|nr:TetR/AcrR family transcriptional regulator [Streptomyces sp. S1D4-11]
MRVVAKSDLTGRARPREAALELFAEHGFAATSTRSVAAAAGLSAALVTRHFGSKQGPRAAVDEYVLDRIGEQLRDLDSEEPGRGLIVSLGEVSARVFGANPVLRGHLRHVLLEDSAASAELFGRLLSGARAEVERLSEGSGEQAPDEEWAPFQMLC